MLLHELSASLPRGMLVDFRPSLDEPISTTQCHKRLRCNRHQPEKSGSILARCRYHFMTSEVEWNYYIYFFSIFNKQLIAIFKYFTFVLYVLCIVYYCLSTIIINYYKQIINFFKRYFKH